MELTGEQLFTVALLYGTSFGALAVLTVLWLLGRLPNWIAAWGSHAFSAGSLPLTPGSGVWLSFYSFGS